MPIVATVLTLNDALGSRQGLGVDLGIANDRQQQVEYLALIACGCLDHERGVGIARERIPFATQCLQALFEASFARIIHPTEQQVLQQVRQFLLVTAEVVQAHAHDQANGHMVAFVAVLEDDLQAVGQQVALHASAVQGKGA